VEKPKSNTVGPVYFLSFSSVQEVGAHKARPEISAYNASPVAEISRLQPRIISHTVAMQKWEYQVFASHLDPAELVVHLNRSGSEGWELVNMARVTDYYPPKLIEPASTEQDVDAVEAEEVMPVEAFRYIFKRPLE
jgi:hypothetical protein